MPTDFAEDLFDATVRVENLIWIPGAVADPECTADSFRDCFCEYLPDAATSPLYSQLPALARFAGSEDEPRPEDVAEALLNTAGFLVQAASPVKDYHSGGGCTFSWGYYRTCWLYAPTEKDIPAAILAWAKQNDEADRAKYSQTAA